jgi:hypothetical protein
VAIPLHLDGSLVYNPTAPMRVDGKSEVTVMSRRLAVVSAAAVAAAVLIVILATVVQSRQTSSSLDPGLRTSAARVARDLPQPAQQFSQAYGYHHAFALFTADIQRRLSQFAPRALQSGQFAQVQVVDDSSMPPQIVVLRSQKGSALPFPTDAVGRVLQKGAPQFTTMTANGATLRVYLVRMTPPQLFAQNGVKMVLEVAQPQS